MGPLDFWLIAASLPATLAVVDVIGRGHTAAQAMDTLTPGERSARMSLIRGRDTGPERAVRGIVSKLGFRYRLHNSRLPGRPDLVFSALRKVVFVHGCFWHGHRCKQGQRLPKTHKGFWNKKIAQNRARDIRVRRKLRTLGWHGLVVWECQLRHAERVTERLKKFLGDDRGK